MRKALELKAYFLDVCGGNERWAIPSVLCLSCKEQRVINLLHDIDDRINILRGKCTNFICRRVPILIAGTSLQEIVRSVKSLAFMIAKIGGIFYKSKPVAHPKLINCGRKLIKRFLEENNRRYF